MTFFFPPPPIPNPEHIRKHWTCTSIELGRMGAGSVLTTPSPPPRASSVGAGQKDGRAELPPYLAAQGEGLILLITLVTVSLDDMDWSVARSEQQSLVGTCAGFLVKCCGAISCISTYVTPAWAPAASLSSLPNQKQSTPCSTSTRII